MDTIDGLRSFVATAQTGSFTAAAEQLGISNRLTSKYVGELEARLGVRLFQRTTRRVGLTPAGEELLARAPMLLNELDDVLAGMSEGARRISGNIRVSAPVTFGETYISGMLGRFAQSNPDLTVDLRLNDQYVDLASDGIDLAFRIGVVEPISFKARKLGEMNAYLVASPDYLAREGAPETPEDLIEHACIVDTNRRNPRRWPLCKDGAETVASVSGRFQVNSARAARELAIAGLGVAYSPHFAVADDLAAGRLVRLMADYSGAMIPVSAVYLEGSRLPYKIRALIDFALQDIRSSKVL